jgi:hypothetical protein
MSFPPLTPAQRRRLLWRRLLERKTLVRHPVSLTRQRIGWLLLGIIIIGMAWYAFTTRDAAIRQRVTGFLAEATSGEVHVGRAHFEMFGGITLHDVRVSVPADKRLDPTAADPRAREIFKAEALHLIHNPWRLLLGDLRVEEIVAAGPTIILAQNVDTGLRNWQLLSTRTKAARGPGRGRLRPRITLRAARAEVVSIDATGRHETRAEELDADVRPHPQAETAYCIEVRRYTDPAERTTVVFDPGQRLVTNTPFVDARTIRLQLPRPAQQFFDRIALQGEVKLSRLIYDVKTPQERSTTIELRSVYCKIPLSMLRSGTPAKATDDSKPPPPGGEEIAITMTGVQGRMNLRGSRLDVNVFGAINGANCKVKGKLDHVGDSLSEMGMDLEIQGTRVPAPEGALRERILTDPSVPTMLREIFEDYEPHGGFDIDFRFARAAGPAAGLEFSGTLQPQGANGRCPRFAYLINDLRGQVRFTPGQIYIEKLTGRHESAVVTVNGVVDRTTWSPGVNVEITGSNVPFDDDLHQALSDRYRSIWQRCNPRGAAEVTVQVLREGRKQSDPSPPWHTPVTADLHDAKITFTEYPYPLENVEGRLEIEGDQIRFSGLTGRHNEATARIDGTAAFDASGAPLVDLRIEARRLRLDATLAAALPPEGRAAFEQFRPEGFADLTGTVSLQDPDRGVVYDLRTRIYETSLSYRDFPYPITNASGEISVRPEAITILEASGHHGAGEVTARGEVRRLEEGYAADLTFGCTQLSLDQDLYESLPGALQSVWRLLDPAGSVNVTTFFHCVSQAGHTWQRHRTEIEPIEAKVCFKGMPLPLVVSSGRVLVTDDKVEFISLGARAASGTIAIGGEIDFSPPGTRGTLAIDAKDMTFSSDLLSALPLKLRQAVDSMKPSGKFDLRLNPLQFDLGSDGKAEWNFSGAMALRDTRTELGFDLQNINGLVNGHGRLSDEAGTSIEARMEFRTAVLAGWPLEDLTARIVAEPGSPTIQLQDAAARLYDGETSGFAEIRLGDNRVEYQASITARDLQLARYLEATRSREATAVAASGGAKGSIYGNMILRGRSGSDGYREGAGEVFLREAEVWRLPVIFGVYQVLNLTPDENVFHDGWLKYYLSGSTLTLQQIDLQGKAMSFIGGGRMDLRGKQLDVTLLAGSPIRLRVPLLTDLLQGASREVMQVEVTGTLQKPQIKPQPLRSLSEALKTLFPEPPPAAHPGR